VKVDKVADSVPIRVSLPEGRMRQLEAVASECGVDPANLARTWIVERLIACWVYSSGLPATSPTRDKTVSLGESGASSPPTEPTPPESQSLLEVKKMLAEKWITDPEERALFLQTNRFKQWANYIAGLVLTKRGQTSFTPSDVKKVLRQDLIPDHYNRSGALDNEVLTADVRIDAPPDYPHGYPCLRRIGWGLYEFAGLKQGISERYGDQDLKRKLSKA
jgi:hypothetical protein